MYEGLRVLGENLNASCGLRALGHPAIMQQPAGRVAFRYANATGEECLLDLTEHVQSPAAQKTGQVSLIAAALLNRDEEFVATLAVRQVRAGAEMLDCCVDGLLPAADARREAMGWLIGVVQRAVRVPLAFDTRFPETMLAALEVYDFSAGKPLFNSLNLNPDRLALLAPTVAAGAAVLGNASGGGPLPETAEACVANMLRMWEAMDRAGLPLEDRTLDPLLLPVRYGTHYPMQFLQACRLLRERLGWGWHLTGGFSNVSYGLPQRRPLNEAMCRLAREAGCDVAIIDPLQVRPFAPDEPESRLALATLRGEDPNCRQYLQGSLAQSKP
jgi:5-methyltetrahydrofolate--homocysteine methyltransferase